MLSWIVLLPSFTVAQSKTYCLPLGTAQLVIEDAVRAHSQDVLVNLYQIRLKSDSVAYSMQAWDYMAQISAITAQRDNLQQQNVLKDAQLQDRDKQKEVQSKQIKKLKGTKTFLEIVVVVLSGLIIKNEIIN